MKEFFTQSSESIVQSNRTLYTASAFARSSLLHLQEIGELKALQAHESRSSGLNSYLFFTVIDGSGTLEYNGSSYNLKTSDCVFIDCREPYSHSTDDDLWTLKWIHFTGPSMDSIYEKYKERGGRPTFTPTSSSRPMTVGKDKESVVNNGLPESVEQNYNDRIQSLWTEIMTIARSDDYMRDMLINQQLSTLLTLLMSQSWHPEDKESLPSKRRVLPAIRDYLDSNYNLKITLDDLAERYYLNKYYLSKSFKSQYGVSINNYLLSVRITKAKQMLRFTDLPIEAIGLECGLGSAHYFSSKFKEVEGVSPSVYREQW